MSWLTDIWGAGQELYNEWQSGGSSSGNPPATPPAGGIFGGTLGNTGITYGTIALVLGGIVLLVLLLK